MTATLVPTVRTTYTTYDIIKALIQGWKATEGSYPTKQQVGVIWAQNALETGQSTSMWCNNIGNVKYVSNANDPSTTQYCMLANVWEVVNGQKVMFQPPSPATWFRAFPTLADGVTFQLGFLKNTRYRNAWTAVQSGNPAAFAHLLKLAGYYTAPESDYVAAINTYFNRYMKDTSFESAMTALNTYVEVDPGFPAQEPTVVLPPEPTPAPVVQGNIIQKFTGLFSAIFKK